MEKKYLLLGIHNHQPVGNFEHVLEYAFENCYKPFIEVLKKYPKIKLNIHFSGWLLEWLERKHKDYLEEIATFVKEGKIEVFAGGFYEPILPIFPIEDRIFQIKKLKTKIKELFDVSPEGLWLAERVWEQELVKTLSLANINYLPLDDFHFELSGIDRKNLEGYYITEYEGYTVSVFPINKELRYMIPFDTQEKIIDYLKNDTRKFFTFFDDGEKFGLWPGTFKHVYENGWLDKFFTLISESEWLETVTFSEFFQKFKPSGKIYIPSSSYFEMLNWSLPSKVSKNDSKYLGNWRNFFLKYPESNLMHKKILYVRDKIKELLEKDEKVLDLYLKSQFNDVFWHGLFGGIYLPHLRKAVYESIILAEKAGFKEKNLDILDIDCDSFNEIVVSDEKLNLYIDPDYGGRIFELDFKEKNINVINTISRRYESYHEKLNDQEDLILDWYDRFSLIDHFFGCNTSLENFSKVRYEELGDFVNQPFEYEISNGKIIMLFRKGFVWFDGKLLNLELTKFIETIGNEVQVSYKILNTSEQKIHLWYGCEFNFSLLSDKNGRYVKTNDQITEPWKSVEVKTDSITIFDDEENLMISIIVDKQMKFWSFPIYTVSYSENGPEKIFQSLCIVPNIEFDLDSREKFEFKLSLKFAEA
jgi:alpha-amylase